MQAFAKPKVFVCLIFLACILLALLRIGHKKFFHVYLDQEGQRKWTDEEIARLPWFFSVGRFRPPLDSRTKVWPEEDPSDRITNQLMLNPIVPEGRVKKIYAPPEGFSVKIGSSFFEDECIVKQCAFVRDPNSADAVIFRDNVFRNRDTVPSSQIWILYVLESPLVSGAEVQTGSVNWTATYRADSDIVTPYEKWVYYDDNFRTSTKSKKNWIAGKSKQVAWFVSNCQTTNGRLEYAQELQKYIDVDIYGACGDLECPRDDDSCFEMLQSDYKFYLAFENSNCRHYITEKFFVNGLQNNVIPIVMGAHPDDYKAVAPEHSYIHVDDFPSARDLADYLQLLSSDSNLYNSYFQWKGTGEFINTRFFCRVCAMLHTPRSNKHYSKLQDWWAGADDRLVCRDGSWLN